MQGSAGGPATGLNRAGSISMCEPSLLRSHHQLPAAGLLPGAEGLLGWEKAPSPLGSLTISHHSLCARDSLPLLRY